MTKRSKGRSRSPRAPSRRTRRRRRAGRNQMRRAYDDDPLAFVDTLMKRFGEAGGREAFLKFVAENDPDSIKQAPALADLAARVKYDPKGSARMSLRKPNLSIVRSRYAQAPARYAA